MSYEIRESDFLILRALNHHLSLLSSWNELIECSLLYLGKLVTNECLCWNEWNPSFDGPKYIQVVEDYHEAAISVLPSIAETIDHHPVLVAVGWNGMRNTPYRLSDYQSYARFRENPLFKEVYVHLDAHHQLAYHFTSTSSAELIITMNRRLRDFSERERQLLKVAGDLITPYAHRIHQDEDALQKASIIADLMEKSYGLININKLSPSEVFLLKDLASGLKVSSIAETRSVRRDTVSRQLSIAREKLGLDSNKEILSALHTSIHGFLHS